MTEGRKTEKKGKIKEKLRSRGLEVENEGGEVAERVGQGEKEKEGGGGEKEDKNELQEEEEPPQKQRRKIREQGLENEEGCGGRQSAEEKKGD